MTQNLPISQEEKKEVLLKAIDYCEQKELGDLYEEICLELRRRAVLPKYELIKEILEIEL